jgi:hypothetical protein
LSFTWKVGRLKPSQSTVLPATRFEPFTVKVNAPVPDAWVLGERDDIVGMLTTRKGNAEEVPPPGVGLKTVTIPVVGAAMSAAAIEAVNWAGLTNVVVRLLPFHFTAEPCTKPTPFTVRVKAAAPGRVVVGDRLVAIGEGFVVIENSDPPNEPALGIGLTTETNAVPADARSAVVIVAVSCVEFT